MAISKDPMLWRVKKRYLGLPISFTSYSVSEDRLFRDTGFFKRNYEEVLLYRVRDISLSRSLGQMIFGVGTITIISSDKSSAKLLIENVKAPREVKELIHEQVEDLESARASLAKITAAIERKMKNRKLYCNIRMD